MIAGGTLGSARNVSALDAHVGFWLRFVSNAVSGRFRARVEAAGVTVSEWVALRTLYDADGSSHGALVATLGMTKGAVSKVLVRLERKKLVRRHPDGADGRSRRLRLTATGRDLVPRLAAIADENDAHFFAGLAPGDRAALVSALRGIVRTIGLTQVPTE